MMKKLHDSLAAGNFKGKRVYDFSIGFIIHQLYTVSDCYSEITILKLNDTCIMELKKWLAMRTGAFDWAHAHNYAKELESTSDHEDLNKEEKLKNTIKQIMKLDLQKGNLTDPEVLEQADCIITAWLLDVVSFLDVTCEDYEDYDRNLKKIANLLKPGGHLILFGLKNTTYLMIGNEKFHVLELDETHVTKVLTNEGFTINHCDVQNRKAESDLCNYEGVIFIVAHK
ncbi:hypothetical protein PRIEUP_LOCUS1938, partial [Pristimantis euphronides]